MKTCTCCGERKELSEFYTDVWKAHNVSAHCKECMKTRARAYNKTAAGIAARKKGVSAHKKRWPERNAARVAVSKALKKGRLEKMPCERCGNPDVQAHHENYAKKLDVSWLCRPCHIERHVAINAEARASGVVLA